MFTKLFNSIIYSSIWMEDDATRVVWITLLAMADRKGFVYGSVRGLAKAANVEDEKCRLALEKFLGPDADSSNPENEGRRIELVPGGWRLLNYERYRGMRDEEQRRQYRADWMRNRRQERRGEPEKLKTLKRIKKGGVSAAELLQEKAIKDGDHETAQRMEELRAGVSPAMAEFRERFNRTLDKTQEDLAKAEAEANARRLRFGPEPVEGSPGPEGVEPGESFPEV